MKTVNISVALEKSSPTKIQIGRQGENRATKVIFDCSVYAESFGPGTAYLFHQRAPDTCPYPVAIEQDGNTITWEVSASDTEFAGQGQCELRWHVDEVIAKTQVWSTTVTEALAGTESEEVPEAAQGWVSKVLQAIADIGKVNDEVVKAAVAAYIAENGLPDTGGVGFTSWSYDTDTGYIHLYNEDGEEAIEPLYAPGLGFADLTEDELQQVNTILTRASNYAAQAGQAKEAASASAENATKSAQDAATSAERATQSASAAATSETNASKSASAAAADADLAKQYNDSALKAAGEAAQSLSGAQDAAETAQEAAQEAIAARDGFKVDTTLSQSGQAADAKAVGDALSSLSEEKVNTPAIAEIGQVLAVKSVDENGKPIEFEAVKQSGGTGDSVLSTKEIIISEETTGGTWYFEDINATLEDGQLVLAGTVSLAGDVRYKHFTFEIPDNTVTFSTKCHPSYSTSANNPYYPPIMISADGGTTWEAVECEFTTASSVCYVATATVIGKKGQLVNLNMYRGGSGSDTTWPGTSGIAEYVYYSIPESSRTETITRPAYDDEFIPTIDDTGKSECKTYSSKKIEELFSTGKANRPSGGVEHFTVSINKADPGINTNTTGVQDDPTEYTDAGVLFLPVSYTANGTPTRLIISCHGSGTVIDDSFTIDTKSWNNFLYQMGYAIMDVNGGADDSRHFGAPFAIQSYIKAYQYVVNKYNLYSDVFVLGGSMGGLSAFTLSQCGAIPVKALAGFCPVVDLLRQAWMNPWYGGSSGEAWGTQRQLIAEYYNFDGYDTFSGWTNAKTPSEAEMQYFLDNADKWQGYNPMTCGAVNGSAVLTTATSDYVDLYNGLIKPHKVPVKIWQSDADPTVPAEFGKYIVQAIKNAGGIAYHRSYPSGGHAAGWGDTVSVQSPQGLTLTPYTNEYECYLWFKRWE